MLKQRKSGIYKITCLVNNIFYIGSSFDLGNRISSHIALLNCENHTNIHLQNAWNLYGSEKFIFEIVEEVPMLEKESKLDFKKRLVSGREQFYLDNLLFAQEYLRGENNKFRELGYNISPNAESNFGSKISEKGRNNIRRGLRGRKLTSEHKNNIGKSIDGINHPLFGKKHKKETIEKFWKSVIQYTKDNKFLKEWKSIESVREELKINVSNITQVCKGTRLSAGGYKWEYKNPTC